MDGRDTVFCLPRTVARESLARSPSVRSYSLSRKPLDQHDGGVRVLPTVRFRRLVFRRVPPLFRLVEAFKLQQHQSLRVRLPFQHLGTATPREITASVFGERGWNQLLIYFV